MAHIHKQLTLQDNDIISPEDFNSDMRELAGEYNGMLDRDNFSEQSLRTADLAPESFTKIYTFNNLNMSVSNETTSFQNGLMSFIFEAESDGVLICEFSGGVHFENPPSVSNQISDTCQILTLQMTVNGAVIGEILRTSGGSSKYCVYMVGAIPISPGRVIVSIRGMTADTEHSSSKNVLASSVVKIPQNELVMIHRKR